VNVLGYYGLSVVASPIAVTVGPRSVLVPFVIANTGNQGTTVRPTVANNYSLLALGWKSSVIPTSGSGSPVKYLPAESSIVEEVNLTAPTAAFAPPGSVTVSVTAVNASGAVAASATLPIPTGSVGVQTPKGGAPLTVTGPSVGSPPKVLPDWLVPLLAFVPTLALLGVVLSYRWWRTRRWTRR
jgi:hypothetical protein